MKNLTWGIVTLTMVAIFSSILSAEEAIGPMDWRAVYRAALEKGKVAPVNQAKPAGLAYAAPEEVVLAEAIAMALMAEKGERVCECLKIAIELEYNPYLVLKNIYAVGGDLEIDQLCMCATEAGVMKAIIAKAAKDAMTPLNQPVYDIDEIAQSQCLKGEDGLAYTLADNDLKEIPIDDNGDKNFASNSSPSP
ncbi:MAG: hypothetical protein RBT11_08340 [Desulfobacterales bacterium]|jgi:hypothetical protein|nr:hypothetical protein [Desulfobacterales bacterium]